jgi:poly(3-hydroxybutyrate) depolymerase
MESRNRGAETARTGEVEGCEDVEESREAHEGEEGKKGEKEMTRRGRRAAFMAFALLSVSTSAAQVGLDESVPSGNNYDKAEFRLWLPATTSRLRAILVLVPGSNGDGRPMADDPVWQAFAAKHNLAIVACRFTDKPHEQSFIEHYVNVSQGSGQALLDVLNTYAAKTKRLELTQVPFLMWGMSAGGQFNYEFTAWKPDRVAAFVLNKGGIYYSALVSNEARKVPGILFIGGKDIAFRNDTIRGLFAVNRRAGALWALAEEPGAAHAVGRSRDLSLMFFEDVLPLRVSPEGTLRALSETPARLGNFAKKAVDVPAEKPPSEPTAWLLSDRVARAWAAMLNGQPFEQ